MNFSTDAPAHDRDLPGETVLPERVRGRHPRRWRLARAGIVNVWHYLDAEFVLSGGRMILRGTNGSGKSRALEMLLPFLLDADRKRMDATGAAKVGLDELMHTGAGGQTNRVGYLWLELVRPDSALTIGAHVRYSATARRSEVYFFTTPLRVGVDLHLVDDNRVPLSREDLVARVGSANLTRDPEEHRTAVRESVFGLRGETGRDRYDGLLQLLHTLRSPDVGNRIDEGRLPQILSEALPPLAENMLAEAGGQLDLLGEIRQDQVRLETAHAHVRRFHSVYRRYATDLLRADAEAAVAAADRTLDTQRALAATEADAAELDAQAAAADTRMQERRDQVDELDRALRGLETHELFRAADDLAQRQLAVDALGRAADLAVDAAEQARARERAEADDGAALLDELAAAVRVAAERAGAAKRELAAAGVPHADLPTELRLDIDRPAAGLEPVRIGRDVAPEPRARPAPVRARLFPEPTADWGATGSVEQSAGAARRRHGQVRRRLAEAQRLADAAHAVHDAEIAAEHAAREAERVTATVDEADAAVRAAALALRHGWREWITSVRTTTLLPEVESNRLTLMRRLSHHLDAVTDGEAEVDDDPILSELDTLPAEAARSALEELDRSASELLRLDTESRVERDRLLARQLELEAADDGPEHAPWHVRSAGVPLWRAVDFVDTLGDDDRAGIEAALLSAGFLTATIDGEGRLRAQSGQVLVSPRGEIPTRPLSSVLRPRIDLDVPLFAVTAVLNAIGFEDPSATASVSRDGRWHNGVLRGRHSPDTARFIGEAARSVAASERRVELDGIGAELSRLDRAAERRTAQRSEPVRRRRELDDHVAAAPTSRPLRDAMTHLREAERRARSATEAADAARSTAAGLRANWTSDLDTHRAACSHFALPTEVPELEALAAACTAAEGLCGELARDLTDVAAAYGRFVRAEQRIRDATRARRDAEALAESHWHDWHAKAAIVAAQVEAVDVDAADLAQELRNSELERGRAEEQFRRTVTLREHLGKTVAEVLQQCAATRERLERDRAELASAAATLAKHLQVPEIRAAAAEHRGGPLPADTLVHLGDPEHVRSVARDLLGALPPSSGSNENRMLAALQRFDRDVSGRFRVEHTVTDGAHVVSVTDVEEPHGPASTAGAGSGTPTGVLEDLARRVEEGRRALSQRERDVFTGFVLGGVADELRRRIGQAEQLVEAMSASLSDSRTTHGIGVRISWRPLREDPDAELVTRLLTDTARSAGETEELIELLRRRVEASHAADPSAGYAIHLSQALDYRRWHTVEVTILGPEPGQERRISARAKISQGETRFVSYVALFAAADGYLSGLPDTDLALRLVLLDDAFAKIDEPTIGELMGLLVRQDIDFVMTGHALWGCVPQVPSLDIYEVRRLEDGSAVTTRVHWDGRTRRLRPRTEPEHLETPS